MVKFPAELDSMDEMVLHQEVVKGFTVTISTKFYPAGGGFVLLGEITQRGFFVVGCGAYKTTVENPILAAMDINALRVMELPLVKLVANSMGVDMRNRIVIGYHELIVNTMIARWVVGIENQKYLTMADWN